MQRMRVISSMLSLLVLSAAARAESTDCTEITSVPTHIFTPGVYCLKQSLSYSGVAGSAIQINVGDVVIDLNGHVLDNSSAGAGTISVGINGQNLKNVTVRNGTIRGFRFGVQLTDLGDNSMAHVVEELLLDRNTTAGINVSGQGSVIRNNRIVRTGGSTAPSNSPDAFGIVAAGVGVHVIANEVTGTLEGVGGQAFGIFASSASGGAVERNVVSALSFGPAASTGIFVTKGSVRVAVAGNRVANQRIGISSSFPESALYVDNTVGGATTPFSGGTKAGTTNHSF
jgi:hypothetical protein